MKPTLKELTYRRMMAESLEYLYRRMWAMAEKCPAVSDDVQNAIDHVEAYTAHLDIWKDEKEGDE